MLAGSRRQLSSASSNSPLFHAYEEDEMGKYIMLGNWTDQGVRDAKNTAKRARAVREQFASLGVNAREFFWTMGQYDVVLTFDAPDDETKMRATRPSQWRATCGPLPCEG
jgi:uncharacterized protein with GYD domain